jgi:hypothetical protein
MLSWLVIVSPHRPQALGSQWNPSLHPRLFVSSVSRKSFLSNPFRTLASHLDVTASSNSCEIKRFRTLSKIPGIEYPPPSLFLDRHSIRSPLLPAIHPFSLQPLTKWSSRNSFVLTTIYFHGGVYPSQAECPLTGRCYPVAPQQERPYLFSLPVVTDFFFHNEGGPPPPSKNQGPK